MRRMPMIRTLLPLLLLAVPAAAHAQPDLSTLDAGMAGPPTSVLVLATEHLDQGGAPPGPQALDALLDRLARFAPEIVIIEAMPGETCDLMARHPVHYDPEGRAHYCPDTAAARAATGLDVPAAIASVDAQLADWPQAPTPAQRR